MPIYLAQRLKPGSPEEEAAAAAAAEEEPPSLPAYAPAIGGVAALVGAVSIGWALAARPDIGGSLSQRWDYFSFLLSTSRVDWAFAVDSCLYAVWQAWLMGACGAPATYRFTPFFGLAAWLLAGGPREGEGAEESEEEEQPPQPLQKAYRKAPRNARG